MANTLIQIRRSTANATPQAGSLSTAELAYSYVSDRIFIGDAAGTGVLEIGGKYHVDLLNVVFGRVNAFYTTSNTSFESANAWANQVGAASNTWANTVGIAGNNYTVSVGVAGNNYTIYTGASGNAYTNLVGSSANAWANQVGVAGNSWAVQVGAAGNVWTNAVGVAANSYAGFMANSVNTYTDIIYYQKTGGLIQGNVTIHGTLSVQGNTYFVDQDTLRVGDPLIYLAGNNYTTDMVDIGFVGNYVNASSVNVHTGLFRSAGSKQYYLFQGYDKEPDSNFIDPNGNNFTLAVLNADLITSNLRLGGANAIVWIKGAYDTTNAAYDHANSIAISANAWANQVGVSGNAWANAVGTAGNNYMITVTTAGNNYTTNTGAAGNAWANLIAVSANAYTDYVGSISNTNASNASYMTTGTVPSGRMTGYYTGITGVGILTAGTWQADTVKVPYGGTGMTAFATNGVLYGNNTGDLKVTSAGLEGQVLTASATGVPSFQMLDGGTF